MQVVSRGLARMGCRSVLPARSLHCAGGTNLVDGERVDASVGKLLGSVQAGDDSKVGARNLEWKAEGWRSPTPMIGGHGLIGGGGVQSAPGVVRGFNSSGSKCEAAKTGGECQAECCKGKDKCKDDKDGSAKAGEDEKKAPVVLKGEGKVKQHPVWDRKPIDFLLENNRRWVAEKTAQDPEFFKKVASVHQPDFLFVCCSDARLSVSHMLGTGPGEVFVHRNIGNMVMHNDLNFMGVLHYAVEYLKVKHIIVCGHYDCGGVRAATRNYDHGLVENWVIGIKDVARIHREELNSLKDDEAMHRRLVELNVQEQCVKLFANPIMQKSQSTHGVPYVHAMVFDIELGLLKELDIDFKDIIRKNRHIYSMYDFSVQQ